MLQACFPYKLPHFIDKINAFLSNRRKKGGHRSVMSAAAMLVVALPTRHAIRVLHARRHRRLFRGSGLLRPVRYRILEPQLDRLGFRRHGRHTQQHNHHYRFHEVLPLLRAAASVRRHRQPVHAVRRVLQALSARFVQPVSDGTRRFLTFAVRTFDARSSVHVDCRARFAIG